MKAPRTYRAGRFKELAYLARFLGPVEFVRQVATRYRIEAAYSERRSDRRQKAQPGTPMFQGVPGSHAALPALTPDGVTLCSPEEQSRELTDLIARQAATIRKLEAQLADAREILFLTHEALLQRNLQRVHRPMPRTRQLSAKDWKGSRQSRPTNQ